MSIDARAVSELLGLSVITLQQMRRRGDGPAWFKTARGRAVRYRLADVLAYRAARTVGSNS
jgi:predicted DNA-binding transcriptional regulator AlpA